MSKPRYDWWSYIKAIIRRYPERLTEYRSLHTPSLSVAMTGLPGAKNNTSDPTASTALREMPPRMQKEFDAVHKAVQDTLRSHNGQHKIKLIKLMFWEKSYGLQNAALQVHISYRTARRWHSQFICLVADNLGMIDKNGPQEPNQ